MKLTEKQQEIFEELFVRYPVLNKNRDDILKAYEMLKACYENGGKLLVAGNGGSCADAEHIVGELMKASPVKRRIAETPGRGACRSRGRARTQSAGQFTGYCFRWTPGTFHGICQ